MKIDNEKAYPVYEIDVKWLQDGEHDPKYPNWYKVLTILIGVLSIVAAGIVLFFLPAVSGPALVAILATTFIFSGAGWIYAGIKQIEEV